MSARSGSETGNGCWRALPLAGSFVLYLWVAVHIDVFHSNAAASAQVFW